MHHLAGGEPGQTPIEPDEADALIPSWVTTRSDLDLAEQENIAKAVEWSLGARPAAREIVDEPFLRQLHKRMFGDVWRWAGVYRTTAKNIGVDPWLIVERLTGLVGDARYWIANGTYEPDEIAVRFHHRLVSIHPFPNGNGRHGRLAADLLVESLGRPRFTWGLNRKEESQDVRRKYIATIIGADSGEVVPLLVFARS